MADTPIITGIDLQKSLELRQGLDPARERAQVQTLAQEFEAMLMLQMIREMRQSMLDEEESVQGLGGETMRDTFDVELSRHLARAGGFGLGDLLSAHIGKTGPPLEEGGVNPAKGEAGSLEHASPSLPLRPEEPALPLVPGPISLEVSDSRQSASLMRREPGTEADTLALAMPVDGATTSAFGWRANPLNGRARFHHGVDLRAAYGADVPAAEAGRVVFAGERGAYGNLVVVRHDNGFETRYAHLASIAVQPGATVAAGDSIGRVGSSGRSTAPHLHFEVLVNGERVDPERVAARLGRGPLKLGSQADD